MLAMTGLLLDRALRRLYAACAGLAGCAIVLVGTALTLGLWPRAKPGLGRG